MILFVFESEARMRWNGWIDWQDCVSKKAPTLKRYSSKL